MAIETIGFDPQKKSEGQGWFFCCGHQVATEMVNDFLQEDLKET